MDLYVIRHAKAQPRGPEVPDARRALTPGGREKFALAVRGLHRLGARFDLLLHSPWLRAVQTADVLESLVDGSTRVTDALAGPPSPDLLGLLDGDRVAVVGHEPWLSQLVCWLVAGDADLPADVVLGKGAVAHLVGDPQPGRMALAALFPAGVLRQLA